MLTSFRTKPSNPNYIVIATADSVLGLTLFNKAYVIFTYIPNSLTELKQAAGRGEREDPNLSIKGSLLTSKFYAVIDDLELALAGAEGKERSLQLDYA